MDEYDFEQSVVRKNRKRLSRRSKSRDESLLDREAPFNLAAEKGVLGSIMLMPDACDDIVNILEPQTSTTKLTRNFSST